MFQTYVYRNVNVILEGKNLLQDVIEIATNLRTVDHKAIGESLQAKGWAIGNNLLPETKICVCQKIVALAFG